MSLFGRHAGAPTTTLPRRTGAARRALTSTSSPLNIHQLRSSAMLFIMVPTPLEVALVSGILAHCLGGAYVGTTRLETPLPGRPITSRRATPSRRYCRTATP